MLSSFGKLTRKLRIDKGEILKEMASKLEVTSAYLSAVEMGKRNVPDNWPIRIAEIYKLSEQERDKLEEASYESRLSIKFDLKDKCIDDRGLILAFARKLDALSNLEKDRMMEILVKRK